MQKMQELLGRVSLDELSAFVAIVESTSFVEAAKVVGKDPTIVSRRLAQLEARLGV
ncbi:MULTISPECIES: helix-turn-helix domain-containing protein [Pseudomonas]|uniref:helix-turn-helix domain-containing protein n=1 Tax=Pseudomonas TaxID=286 RepID=UPI001E61409B|nr:MULTISPECIES: LysR family transcriptional regulator [Pseudomonas]